MTGTQRISAALVEIGKLGAGQTASGPLIALGLEHLQRIFDSWGADHLVPHALLRTIEPLVSGTRDYTIGSGGTIDIVRPVRIERAGFVYDSTATDPLERPIAVLTDQEWAAIRQKTLDGSVLKGIFYDKAFSSAELGTISTYPTIDTANTQLVLYTRPAVVGYAALSDDLEFPPAYDDAIHYELSRRICRPLGRPMTADLLEDARRTFAAMTLANYQPAEVTLDPLVPGHHAGRADVRTGEPR